MKSTQNLPLRLKELRNKHNYSQEQLAEILNVSRQAVSRWENGKAVPDIDNMLFLAELYDVPLDYLLGEELCLVDEGNTTVDSRNVTAVMEGLVLSIILILASNLSIIGLIVSVVMLVWLITTKKCHKFLYILSLVCILINVYGVFIIFTHLEIAYGNTFFMPK